MPSKKYKTPVEPDNVYHIYNRGINKSKIFYRKSDYTYFLEKYIQYVAPHVKTYAFCFIPNHFHFLFRINKDSGKNFSASEHLRRFFMVYAQRINYLNDRYGSLFCKSFKRLIVKDEDYFKRLVFYIHHNPVKHQLTEYYQEYPFSSYKYITNGINNIIELNELFSIFGGLTEFIDYHSYLHEEIYIEKLILEE